MLFFAASYAALLILKKQPTFPASLGAGTPGTNVLGHLLALLSGHAAATLTLSILTYEIIMKNKQTSNNQPNN